MAKLKLVELFSWDDPQIVCRDERCPIEGVHRVHAVVSGPQVKEKRLRPTIDECVYAHIGMRRIRAFREVYGDVVHDYGTITERGVYRSIERLIDERKVIRVVPWPNGRSYRLGCYLRYESPLIWDRSGQRSIQEQLQELGFCDQLKAKPCKTPAQARHTRRLWNQGPDAATLMGR